MKGKKRNLEFIGIVLFCFGILIMENNRAFSKPTKGSSLITPVVSVNKGVTEDGMKYITVKLKKYSGTNVEIFFKTNRSQYKKITLATNDIHKMNGRFKIRYLTNYKDLYIKARTYEGKNQRKRYSEFSKPMRLNLDDVMVKNVSIQKPKTPVLFLKKGESYTMKAKALVSPNTKGNQEVTYKSDNTRVATVSTYNGKIKARKEGKAVITATSSLDESKKAKLKVRVEPVLSRIRLNHASLTLKVGESTKLKVFHTPKNVGVNKVAWSTNNTNVSVSGNGKVTARREGKATITAKVMSGNAKKASCKVTVESSKEEDRDAKPTPTPKPLITPTLEPDVAPTPKPLITPTIEPLITPTFEPVTTPTPEPNGEVRGEILPLYQPRYVGDLFISNITLTIDEFMSTLLIDVKNLGSRVIELDCFRIPIYDSSGNELITLKGYIDNRIHPGETQKITSGTDMKLYQADQIQFIALGYKPSKEPILTPSPEPEEELPLYPEGNGLYLPVIQSRSIGDLYIDNISILREGDGLCTFYADVRNESASVIELRNLTIRLFDSLGNKIIEMLGYIGESIHPFESRTIVSSSDMDFSNAVYSRIIVRDYNKPTSEPSE